MTDLPEEPEHVRGTLIAWTITGTLVAIIASVIIVGGFVGFRYDGGGRSNDEDIRLRPPATPFEDLVGSTPLEMARRAQVLALDGWHWGDAAHTRVVLPVDVAIDRYVQHRGAR